MALLGLIRTSGVSCVLVGMRQQVYVQDCLAVLEKDISCFENNSFWDEMKQVVCAK